MLGSGGPNPRNEGPYERRRRRKKRTERRGRVKLEAGSGVTRPRAEAPSGPQKTREARKGSSSGLQTGHAPPPPPAPRFQASGLRDWEGVRCCPFKPPTVWCFVTAARGRCWRPSVRPFFRSKPHLPKMSTKPPDLSEGTNTVGRAAVPQGPGDRAPRGAGGQSWARRA